MTDELLRETGRFQMGAGREQERNKEKDRFHLAKQAEHDSPGAPEAQSHRTFVSR
jgi:hypothetical protein